MQAQWRAEEIDASAFEDIEVEPWRGSWNEDDPDAAFKADVALYANVDPMETIRVLSANVGLPASALVHYVLAKYSTGGIGGLLELGPTMVQRLWERIEMAEGVGTADAKLDGYEQLRMMIGWLRLPLEDPSIYPEQRSEDQAGDDPECSPDEQ